MSPRLPRIGVESRPTRHDLNLDSCCSRWRFCFRGCPLFDGRSRAIWIEGCSVGRPLPIEGRRSHEWVPSWHSATKVWCASEFAFSERHDSSKPLVQMRFVAFISIQALFSVHEVGESTSWSLTAVAAA